MNKAAQQLGSIKTEKKALSSKQNGQNPLKPHFEKVKYFVKQFPYPLENNEWKLKFNLNVKTKTGREATYNPDFHCPSLKCFLEVATSKSNISEQGWKWKRVIELGHTLKVFWWEGQEITNEFI